MQKLILPRSQWGTSLPLLTLLRGKARDPCFQPIMLRPLPLPRPAHIQPPLSWSQRIRGRALWHLGGQPADRNHEELFFVLQGVVLQSCKTILSSYKEAIRSSSRAGQLEHELKALKKEKAQEEGTLQHRLRNLSGELNTLQEGYVANVRRMEAVKVELEGMQAERDSTLLERDALGKERESRRAGRDEMLQTNDSLLGQLSESQRQAWIMEASLEGVRTTEGLGDLVRGSDTGCDLLF
ncbi:hypothetical protein LIER_17892 [Lithospermum erythrorhizon]|uniref:Uncharacterized protein n=1 Tax=Lithospermum erythrorhizon TaxID=34254 RepID=A0AAV3QBX9_LITER